MSATASKAILIIFSGLPGSGKTTTARELARQTGATYVRADTIEQAMRSAGGPLVVGDEGYRVAYAVAEENLRLDHAVVADSVNSLAITRRAWHEVARRADAPYLDVKVVCTDPEEHRRRVETRRSDIADLKQPTWQDVLDREYEAWDEEHLVLDTAKLSTEACVSEIRAALGL